MPSPAQGYNEQSWLDPSPGTGQPAMGSVPTSQPAAPQQPAANDGAWASVIGKTLSTLGKGVAAGSDKMPAITSAESLEKSMGLGSQEPAPATIQVPRRPLPPYLRRG